MQDNHSIYNIYFRIEAGYNGGCMSREQHERFYAEIRRLFTEAGFRIEDRNVGCPDFILGKTRLYCHPESLSGPTEERHIALVEETLRKGVSFRYERTDKYDPALRLHSRRGAGILPPDECRNRRASISRRFPNPEEGPLQVPQ